MKIPRHIKEYIDNCKVNDRPLVSSPLGGIEQAVVIPALAERDSLAATLSSLSLNNEREIGRTLIICVINNRREGVAAPGDIGNNQETLRCLQALMGGLPDNLSEGGEQAGGWQELSPPSLRLAYIDASSPGRELPDKQGGVGTARKIGMDAALNVFDYSGKGEKLLISLDADTLVQVLLGLFKQISPEGRKVKSLSYVIIL